MTASNYFQDLANQDLSAIAEEKMGLTYISWAGAWAMLKAQHPSAHYTIHENAEGLNYHHDGRTAWVKVSVTIPDAASDVWDGTHTEYLPVMDNRNKSILLEDARFTSYAVNNTIQRSLTKAIARHGLGISVYINGSSEGLGITDDDTATPEVQPATLLTIPQMKSAIIEAGRGYPEVRNLIRSIKSDEGYGDSKLKELPANILQAVYDALQKAGYV